MSFSIFLVTCYSIFWEILKPARSELANYILTSVKADLQIEFESLIERLGDRNVGPLIGALRTASTSTHNQVEIVSGWFTKEAETESQSFPLTVAVEIAKRATMNVYRNFPGDIDVEEGSAKTVNLSPHGLAVLYDCLYVIFENAWKHSGLGNNVGTIQLNASFEKESGLLKICVRNRVSDDRAAMLGYEEMAALKEKYLKVIPLELIAREGGSGFAKLARAVRMVDRSVCPAPLEFGIESGVWYVETYIPLYDRGDKFDAYQ
jgi:hypothetical protein